MTERLEARKRHWWEEDQYYREYIERKRREDEADVVEQFSKYVVDFSIKDSYMAPEQELFVFDLSGEAVE